MNRLLLSALLVSWYYVGFSQANAYHPFPLSQKTEWRTDYFSIDCIDQSYSLCASRNYYTYGDSMVGSFKYAKIYRDGISYQTDTILYGSNIYDGLMREDTANKKIYWLETTIEYLIYDFDVSVGDTVSTLLASNLVVTSIDSVLLGNQYHRRFNFENGFPHPMFIVEGMGSNGGLFTTLYDGFGFEGAEVLKCFQINDTTLYEDSSYTFTSCDLSIPTSINEISILQLFAFPNPALLNHKIIVSGKAPERCTYSIYNILGRPVVLNQFYDHAQGIFLASEFFAPGIYLLRIKEVNSMIPFIKFIIQ